MINKLVEPQEVPKATIRRLRKAVICIETGDFFLSCWEATQHYKPGRKSNGVHAATHGRKKSFNGFHWRLATEDEIKKALTILLK